jgi:hypothetical protein
VYSEKTPDDGQRNFPKHVEFHAGVNLGNLCIWLVFFIKKFVTMHGHMDVKYTFLLLGKFLIHILKLPVSIFPM